MLMTIRDARGFTLIEIILVTVLMGIISVFSALFIITGVEGFVTTVENTELAQKAGFAMNRITAEMAREMESVTTLLPGGSSGKTYVKFAYEPNPGDFSPGAYRHISLVGTGTRKELMLAAGDTAPIDGDDEVLLENISAFTMVFSKSDDTDWTTSDDMDDLAKISITLTIFVSDTDSDTVTFSTTVTPPDFDDVIVD